jgi:hypothetical protein
LELRIVSHVSDETRCFVLQGSTGNCLCVVCVEGNTSGETIDWLKDALAERFERTIVRGAASDEKAALAGFFQSSHRRVYREIEEKGVEIGRVSMVVINVCGKTAVLASVGDCAAYRVGSSGAELLLPPEDLADEPSFMGQTLKVRVEMTRQTVCPGVSYVLTSGRIDQLSDWSCILEGLSEGARPSAESMASRIVEGTGGAVGILEVPIASSEASRSDEKWYEELREELTRAAGEGDHEEVVPVWNRRERKGSSGTRPAQKVSFLLAAAVIVLLLYTVWIHWAGPRLRELSRERHEEREAVLSEGAMTGALNLGSIPSGAEVLLDGEVVGSGEPVVPLSASAGTHELTIRHSELGEWVGDVVLEAGDTTLMKVDFRGDVAVSSQPRRGLSVLLDGKHVGNTPCLLEGVAAGFHVVTVGGEDFGPWEEEVLVAHGGVAEVYVDPTRESESGTVSVTSRRMTGDGFEESRGNAVFIDGRKKGSTPFETELKPGLHSVRVSGDGGSPPAVRVLEIRPGARHFVRAELGGVEPLLIECREVRTEADDALVIHASLSGRTDLEIAEVTLYLQRSSQRRGLWQPMLLVPGSRAVYAAAVPEELTTHHTRLMYFARATTSQGLEYFSDIKTIARE